MVIHAIDTDLNDRVLAAGLKTYASEDFTRVEVRFPCGAVLTREVEPGYRVDVHKLWTEALEIQERSI